MKDSLKKAQIKKTIGITSIIIAAIVIGAIILAAAVTNSKSKTIHTSTEPNQQEVSQTNNNTEENVVEIGNLTNISNVTEEELQKINEKELEEAKKKEEEKKKEENKDNKDKTNKTSTTKNQNKYYIKVNYGAQVVNVYTYDKDGKYTVPVKAFVCSTGTETPRSGVYKIPTKITWCHMYGDVWAHYCSQIVGNILFHSVPYLERNNHTLEYWAYDKLGTKASMGCIRLTTRDAKWIYDNVSVGTKVEFYSSSNPGPLGKPSAQKISNAPGNLKWWDPTDPDKNNPWRTYKPATNASNNKNNTTTNNQTGSSNKNEQTGNNQTGSSNKNEQTGNNQTGSSNKNEQTGNNQTGSSNKNEQAGNNQTGSSNKNEQTGNNQTGSSNKNEQTGNNQTESSNKNEQTGNNQTGSSNKNEQVGNNPIENNNQNGQVGNNQTENK